MLERITSQQHARAPKPSPQGKVAASADGKGPLYVPCVRTTQLHAGARTQSYEYLRAPATSNNLQIHQTHKRPAPGAALRSAPVLSLGERLSGLPPPPSYLYTIVFRHPKKRPGPALLVRAAPGRGVVLRYGVIAFMPAVSASDFAQDQICIRPFFFLDF